MVAYFGFEASGSLYRLFYYRRSAEDSVGEAKFIPFENVDTGEVYISSVVLT
jgi:hypothetical protein